MSKKYPDIKKEQERDGFSKLLTNSKLSIEEFARISGKSPRTIYRYDKGDIKPGKLIMDLLSNYVTQDTPTTMVLPRFTFIDLFAGIGGMRMGFENAGGDCVFTSEWNEYSLKTYRENFHCNHKIVGDITKVSPTEIPEHDILLAGFPCQPFSIAGVSKKNSLGQKHGFQCETQGTLFFEIERILASHRPKAFLLENVKNLLSHDKGRTFEVIKKTLKEKLDYYIDWKVINAKGFLPQNRERIYIVGFREDLEFDFNFMELPNIATGPKLKSILHPEDGSEKAEAPYTYGELAEVNEKYTLTKKMWEYLQEYSRKHKARGNGFGYGLVGRDDVARTLSARYYKDGSEILVKQGAGNPRRLTPRECSRLMGFDMPTSSIFRIPVSDTQAYRQFGNAVAVPVVKEIAKYMLTYIFPELKAMNVVRQYSLFHQ